MPAIQIQKTVELNRMIETEILPGSTFTGESGGHEFVFTAKGTTLSGSITARFMRADGTTKSLTGSISNGKASVTLTADCYEVPGRFLLTVFYSGGSGTSVIYAAVGNVTRSSTGTITPSQAAADTFEEILAGYVSDMESAESAANTAATAANTAASAATAAAASSVRYDVSQSLTDAQQARARENIGVIDVGLSDSAKVALLNCFSHVVWVDNHGQTYYDALEAALYGRAYPRITAVFNPGLNVIYTDYSLNTLKQYLTVTYYETEQSTGTVVSSANYTLSGVLSEGDNTIQVFYNTYMTAFSVQAVDFYNIWHWSLGDGRLQKVAASVDANQSDTAAYPSRVSVTDPYASRRTFVVSRGKAPYYVYNQTAVASAYYPIPMPANANRFDIHIDTGRYVYVHALPYDSTNNQYGNSVANESRIAWTQDTGNGVGLTLPNKGNWFIVVNSKYDSSGTTYPTEPSTFTIDFSEV